MMREVTIGQDLKRQITEAYNPEPLNARKSSSLMALWSYGGRAVLEWCNEAEYAVVSNSRTFNLGI